MIECGPGHTRMPLGLARAAACTAWRLGWVSLMAWERKAQPPHLNAADLAPGSCFACATPKITHLMYLHNVVANMMLCGQLQPRLTAFLLALQFPSLLQFSEQSSSRHVLCISSGNACQAPRGARTVPKRLHPAAQPSPLCRVLQPRRSLPRPCCASLVRHRARASAAGRMLAASGALRQGQAGDRSPLLALARQQQAQRVRLLACDASKAGLRSSASCSVCGRSSKLTFTETA